jgi:hypothetical protein
LHRHKSFNLVNETVKPGFKYYSISLMLLLVVSLFCFLINCFFYNIVLINYFVFCVKVFLFLLISEVYGFQYGRHALWLFVLSFVIICSFITITVNFSNPVIIETSIVDFYDHVTQATVAYMNIPRLFEFFSIFYGMQLLSISKKYFAGKLTFIRMFFVGLFVNIVFLLLLFLYYLYMHYNLKTSFDMLILSFYQVAIISFILAISFSIIVKFISKKEGYYIYDRREKYKIFSFILDSDHLHLYAHED